jgi:hypothetical protein
VFSLRCWAGRSAALWEGCQREQSVPCLPKTIRRTFGPSRPRVRVLSGALTADAIVFPRTRNAAPKGDDLCRSVSPA